jgi:hypothetical protein
MQCGFAMLCAGRVLGLVSEEFHSKLIGKYLNTIFPFHSNLYRVGSPKEREEHHVEESP